MKTIVKSLLLVLLVLALLTVVGAGVGTWAFLNEWGIGPGVMVFDDSTVSIAGLGAAGAVGVGLAVGIAVLVTLVLVPGAVLLALLCTAAGLALGALALFGTAALLLSPLWMPLALVVWLAGRARRGPTPPLGIAAG